MSEPPLLVGRYRLERVLGEGATARTWLAEDTSAGSGRRVAVKELPLSRLRKWKDLELFSREAEMLEALDHPGIPRCLDHFMVDEGGQETFYLVEQWVEGESLLEQLERRVKMPEGEVRARLHQILEVLFYLHVRKAPVVHRDIKPANVMVRPDGQIVLIDFGAVRELLHDVEDGSTVVGTFGYMPPEQLHGRASPASDVYAVAATACHLLTGVSPKDMPLRGRPFMLDFRPHCEVSDDLAELLDSMLEPELDDRLCDVEQVLDLLEDIAETSAPAEALAGQASSTSLASPRPGPRALSAGHYLYAMGLPPTWRYLTLLIGMAAAFLGPLGWAVTAVCGVVVSLNLREAWANAAVLGQGTIVAARVAARRPRRRGVELEYTYRFKRRSYRAALLVKAHLVADVPVGSIIHVSVDPAAPEDSVPLLGQAEGLLS